MNYRHLSNVRCDHKWRDHDQIEMSEEFVESLKKDTHERLKAMNSNETLWGWNTASTHLLVDIDGVIRNTIETLTEHAPTDWEWGGETQKVFDENLADSLYVFPGHDRFVKELIDSLNSSAVVGVIFLSCQPNKTQRYYTDCYLKDMFSKSGNDMGVIYTNTAAEKLEYLKLFKNSVLLDDYPLFPEKMKDIPESERKALLDRIFLYEQPWNRTRKEQYRYVVSPSVTPDCKKISDTSHKPREAYFTARFVERFISKLYAKSSIPDLTN